MVHKQGGGLCKDFRVQSVLKKRTESEPSFLMQKGFEVRAKSDVHKFLINFDETFEIRIHCIWDCCITNCFLAYALE